MPETPDVPIRLTMTEKERDRLRIAAAVAKLPMSQLARKIVLEWLEKNFKKK
jgi:hypothetical protein